MRPEILLRTCLLIVTAATSLVAQSHPQTWICNSSSPSPSSLFRFDIPPDLPDANGCQATHNFVVSMPATEGNYLVTVELGGQAAATTTVKAESRRLMLRAVVTKERQMRREQFVVNVRSPQIAPGVEVHRKPREMRSLDWDDRLTLEFSGNRPSLRSVTVEPLESVPTLYLAGDSTVVDQANEPWAAWGQMLPAFFGPTIAISNQAESGETMGSFESELRFRKIFATIKAGDFLIMQFAHNDQKPGTGYVSPERYTALLLKYIALAREKHATPILVTSMNRRTFDASGHIRDTLAPYPALMRATAKREQVALIDLNAMSVDLYQAFGEARSRILFVYAAANTYVGQPTELHDDTHFNNYGAYELARCVVSSIQQQRLPLAHFLRKGIPRFDPSRPDSQDALALPSSPFFDTEKPYER